MTTLLKLSQLSPHAKLLIPCNAQPRGGDKYDNVRAGHVAKNREYGRCELRERGKRPGVVEEEDEIDAVDTNLSDAKTKTRMESSDSEGQSRAPAWTGRTFCDLICTNQP
jgi:hypothetical protein